jgi:hypothetical protein
MNTIAPARQAGPSAAADGMGDANTIACAIAGAAALGRRVAAATSPRRFRDCDACWQLHQELVS